MTRSLDWLRLHPWIGTAFFIGAFLGVVICLPLIPFELPEGHASLIGAAFGAFVAVWGAAWVTDGQSRRNQAIAREEIETVVRPTINRFDRLIIDLEAAIDAGEGAGLELATERADAIRNECRSIFTWLREAKPLFYQLGAAGMSGHARLTYAVNDCFEFLNSEDRRLFILDRKENLILRRNAIKDALKLIYKRPNSEAKRAGPNGKESL